MTRLILLGGFLGAGKSTLAVAAAQLLMQRGCRVGIVTNDQSTQLIDTALARGAGFDVGEVAGGCFCCRFPDLMEAIGVVTAAGPRDVIIAEAVGSCTDLVATVLRPMRLYHADQFSIAPLTIVVDPLRLMTSMADLIRYLYQQQLLEADLVLLNKTDLVPPAQLELIMERLAATTGDVPVMTASAQSGSGVEAWLDRVMSETSSLSHGLDIDYQLYADAEAQLGWLNASGTLTAAAPFSPNRWAAAWLEKLAEHFGAASAGIAHVKLMVQSGQGTTKASLTGDDGRISWDMRAASERAQSAHFLLNARVSISPESLQQGVMQTLEKSLERTGARFAVQDLACFSPAPPRPTYRMGTPPDAASPN